MNDALMKLGRPNTSCAFSCCIGQWSSSAFVVASVFAVAYRTVFGLKREEVGGECRQLHHMRIFMTCTACQILLGWSNGGGWDCMGHVACMGDKCVHCLMGTSEGKRLLGKSMCRWADNIKFDLKNKGWYGGWWGGFLGWIRLAWGEVAVNTRHSPYQYYIQVNSQLCAPATLLNGKEFLVFIGGDFAVRVLTWQPVFLQTEPWSCMHSHLLYQANTADMMSCTNRVLTQ
jgi:hypothetical protein